jgi:plastocyanin
MNSLISKRLSGILAVGLVALAVGAAGAPASAAPPATSDGATLSGATVSALTAAQVRARTRELRVCARKRPLRIARACKAAVYRKYRRLANAVPVGKTYTVNLGDNYFAPASIDLKVYDSINWSWATVGGYEPHNVTLETGPTGVSRSDFLSQTTVSPSYRFKRTFKVPGSYSFVCSLHFGMTMTANVTR